VTVDATQCSVLLKILLSLKVILIHTIAQGVCNFLSVLNGNYVLSCAISELFTSQDIHY